MSDSLKNLISERAGSLPEARRGGYDRDSVDSFVTELLAQVDGESSQLEAKPVSALSRRHVERMTAKIAELLDTAEENASEILSAAEAERDEVVKQAHAKAAQITSEAEAEASTKRRAADHHVQETQRRIKAEQGQARKDSERQARELVAEAEGGAREMIEAAEKRKGELAEMVAMLDERRKSVSEGLTQVARVLDGAVQEADSVAGPAAGGTGSELSPTEAARPAVQAGAESETG